MSRGFVRSSVAELRPDIMKQLPTEGKKFKVVDGSGPGHRPLRPGSLPVVP